MPARASLTSAEVFRSIERNSRWPWLLFAVAILGVAWLRPHDRFLPREPVAWDASRFRLVRGLEGAASDSLIWVVTMRPRCAACRRTLARATITRATTHAPVRIEALWVSTPRRLAGHDGSDFLADRVWWDERRVWRRGWGRRVAGEILVFAPTGRFLAAGSPDDADLESRIAGVLEDATASSQAWGVPPDDF